MDGVVGSTRAQERLTADQCANVALVMEFLGRPKPVSGEDLHRYAPNLRLRRLGMHNLAELLVGPEAGARAHDGYDEQSFHDRQDQVVDIIARGDVVWVLFRLTGTHTGMFWGSPGTGQPLDLLEVGIFRIEGGTIAEAWFMNDELAICRQLGLIDAQSLRSGPSSSHGPSSGSGVPPSVAAAHA